MRDRRDLASLAIVCLLAVLAAIVGLHLLRPDLDPRSSHLSYYAVGRYAWLMTLSFLLAAIGIAALAAALRSRVARSAPLSLACSALLLAALTYVALALFVTDVRSPGAAAPTRTTHGQLHDLAARLHGVAWLLAATALPFALGRDERWSATRRWSAAAGVAIVLAIAARVFSPPAWEGATQRLWIGVVLAWSLGHAFVAARKSGAAESPHGSRLTRLLQREFELPVPLALAWSRLAQVEEWPRWAAHIERIVLQPPGEVGPASSGTIHLRNGIRSTFRMREFHPGRSWCWAGPFLWLTVHYDHRFDAISPERSRLTWTIDGEGLGVRLLGPWFAAIYARSLDRAIPRLVRSLSDRPAPVRELRSPPP